MKSLKSLKNIQILERTAQKMIRGGRLDCDTNRDHVCEQIGPQCAQSYCLRPELPA